MLWFMIGSVIVRACSAYDTISKNDIHSYSCISHYEAPKWKLPFQLINNNLSELICCAYVVRRETQISHFSLAISDMLSQSLVLYIEIPVFEQLVFISSFFSKDRRTFWGTAIPASFWTIPPYTPGNRFWGL